MPQKFAICKIIKDESELNQLRRNKEVGLAKSCKECNLVVYGSKKKALELTYQHL